MNGIAPGPRGSSDIGRIEFSEVWSLYNLARPELVEEVAPGLDADAVVSVPARLLLSTRRSP